MRSFGILLFMVLPSCGYQLRGNTRPFFERNQIRNLYVEPVKNDSYKAGIEITVYNALRRRIAQGDYVRIVDSDSLADATFSATVTDASYAPYAIAVGSAITTGDPNNASNTNPLLSNVQIAESYNVTLKVKFRLTTHHPQKVVYNDEILRQKTFPATTYLGPLGSTSALITESDYETALQDLSVNVVTDAEESVNTLF